MKTTKCILCRQDGGQPTTVLLSEKTVTRDICVSCVTKIEEQHGKSPVLDLWVSLRLARED